MFPNYEELQKLVDDLYNQFDIETRLKRYGSVSSELVELAESLGLTNSNLEAARALFLADFIITGSELPGVDDEERRKSITEAFKKGLSYADVDSENLMRQAYLAYNLASTIRKNDLFQAGRGIQRDVSLMRLFDSYLIAYLKYSEDILGKHVDASWPLGMLAAALKKTRPDREIQNLDGLGSLNDYQKLAPVIWNTLLDYSLAQPVETNDKPVIPNYFETSTVLVGDSNKLLISGWNTGRQVGEGNDASILNPAVSFFRKTDEKMKMVYLKGHFLDQPEPNTFIMVREPTLENHPLVFMRTPADDINVTSVLNLLYIRGLDSEGWKSVTTSSEDIVPEAPEEKIETMETEPPSATNQGLFGRLIAKVKSLFGKNGTNVHSPKPSQKTKKKAKRPKNLLPPFLAQALTIDAVSDMAMFSFFDTIRESEYTILGAMESNFERNQANFMGFSEDIDPELVAYILDGLDEVLETATNYYFNGNFQLVPEEIVLFLNEEDKLIITLAGDKKRIVGTIAQTVVSSAAARYADKSNVSQRRTLHMRTGQLHSSLQHTPFDTAVSRIYAEDIKEEPKFFTLDKSILNLA
ncbi:MAG: hypothetical protein D6732_12015 [Methanobacteriota archaeon]|nr:MAG: hypothetical protein D6732_12015 [Euryarchaeota archaeon]